MTNSELFGKLHLMISDYFNSNDAVDIETWDNELADKLYELTSKAEELLDNATGTKECRWCNTRYEPAYLRKEVNMGCLCESCIEVIKSHGEPLTFEE